MCCWAGNQCPHWPWAWHANFSTSSHSSRTIYHIKKMASVSPLATSTNTCKWTRVLSNPRIGILIDHDMVDDELGLMGITQHGQSFLTVVSSGNNGSYYDGPCCSHQGCPTNKSKKSTITRQTHHTLSVKNTHTHACMHTVIGESLFLGWLHDDTLERLSNLQHVLGCYGTTVYCMDCTNWQGYCRHTQYYLVNIPNSTLRTTQYYFMYLL